MDETIRFVKYDHVKARQGKAVVFPLSGFSLSDLTKHRETAETAEEFAAMGKEARLAAKDCGGIVFATLKDGRKERTKGNVDKKTAFVYDYDGVPDGSLKKVEDWVRSLGLFAWIYTTHSHGTKAGECFRVVLPLLYPLPPVYGEKMSRRMAERVGVECDKTTHQAERLFFLPSHPKGAEYVDEALEGELLDIPAPTEDGDEALRKAEDPTKKSGIVGAFCRGYDIRDVIDEFIPGVYESTDDPDRYTYKNGTTSGGFVLLDDNIAYSHHGTDPAGGMAINAYDLVRIHKFKGADEDMRRFAASLPKVEEELKKQAAEDFPDQWGEGNDWLGKLDRTKKGDIVQSMGNVALICDNDPELRGAFFYDTFRGGLFRKDGSRLDDNAMTSLFVRLFGLKYGITKKEMVYDVMRERATAWGRDTLRDYFDNLPEWDGVERVGGLLSSLFGCDADEYHRHIMKMHLTAAVARAYEPGVKYDHCLTLVGPEGTGKSRFVRALCPRADWFSDNVSLEGKAGKEELRGRFLVEFGELASLKRAAVEAVKNYLTTQADTYREAYGRNVTEQPRRCVFFGTSNESAVLRGSDGSRRFLIVEVKRQANTCGDFSELEDNLPQIWAEAKALYKSGFPLFLPSSRMAEASEMADRHNSDILALEEMAEAVRGYIDTPHDFAFDDKGKDEFTNLEIISELWGVRYSTPGDGYGIWSRRLRKVMEKYFPDWREFRAKQRGWCKRKK